MIESIQERISLLQDCIDMTFTEERLIQLDELATSIVEDHRQGSGLVITCGNGGSHSIAQHLVGELAFRLDKKRELNTRAFCLGTDQVLTSAIANDTYPPDIFVREFFARISSNDKVTLICFTTSDRSQNIRRLLDDISYLNDTDLKGKQKIRTVLFTRVKQQHYFVDSPSDYKFFVCSPRQQSLDVEIIQEIHLVYMHLLADLIWRKLNV